MNQITAHSGSNPLPVTFWGKVNEPATVTVKGESAGVDSDKEYRKTVNLNAGSQTVAVVAKDYGAGGGNTTTKNATVNPQGGTWREPPLLEPGELPTKKLRPGQPWPPPKDWAPTRPMPNWMKAGAFALILGGSCGLASGADHGSFNDVFAAASNGASLDELDDLMFDASVDAAIEAGTAGALPGIYGPWWWAKEWNED